jgi:peptide deformylase
MKIVPVDQIPKPEEIVDVPTDDLMKVYKVCNELEQACKLESGIGLSAVQVGIPWRLFVVDGSDGFEYLVNCDYEAVVNEKAFSVEGCLSLRTKEGNLRYFKVNRFKKVRIRGKILDSHKELELKDIDYTTQVNIYNVVYQHEIDHQNGILISEIGEEIQVQPVCANRT